jgi:uncharacterized protein with HEPN domain
MSIPIIEAAQQACSYTAEMSLDEFLGDKRTQQAVILNIIIIGEASAKILQNHTEFTERHPQVPWRAIKGMRNRIAHGYFDIDLKIVWATVQTALPDLASQMNKIRDTL